jgi:hypothetical protein
MYRSAGHHVLVSGAACIGRRGSYIAHISGAASIRRYSVLERSRYCLHCLWSHAGLRACRKRLLPGVSALPLVSRWSSDMPKTPITRRLCIATTDLPPSQSIEGTIPAAGLPIAFGSLLGCRQCLLQGSAEHPLDPGSKAPCVPFAHVLSI